MTKQPAHFPITDPSMLHRLLPHRSPMLLIDTVLSYTEKSVVCSFNVVQDSLFLIDSFFSESGIIEHMAQTVAVHTGYSGYLNQIIQFRHLPFEAITKFSFGCLQITFYGFLI